MYHNTNYGGASRILASGWMAALLLLLGTAFISWNNPGHALAGPVLSSVSATSTDTTATITWISDLPATSQVRYGTTTSLTAQSPISTGTSTQHSVLLIDLTPNTTYLYSVESIDPATTTSATTTSLTQSFTTAQATATQPFTISSVVAVPTATGATITWTTDQPASSQVEYGTTANLGTFSVFDTTAMTNHSMVLSALLPQTLYHFKVLSATATSSASSNHQTFTTSALATTTATTTTATTTPSTLELAALQQMLLQLQNEVRTLQGQVAALIASVFSSGGGTFATTTTTSAVSPKIDQNGQSVRAGTSIDFGGHSFNTEETVTITLNGQFVARAHADGGGNFSTGSLGVPSTAGTYTYHFAGSKGSSTNATITLTP